MHPRPWLIQIKYITPIYTCYNYSIRPIFAKSVGSRSRWTGCQCTMQTVFVSGIWEHEVYATSPIHECINGGCKLLFLSIPPAYFKSNARCAIVDWFVTSSISGLLWNSQMISLYYIHITLDPWNRIVVYLEYFIIPSHFHVASPKALHYM